jgi:double-stranded uracil-DNA glycosylase
MPAVSTPPVLQDVLAKGLSVVFCGLNPALSAARDGHNFSNRSNRFWQTLHLAGFTDRRLAPEEEFELLRYGCGLTAVVSRATRGADEVSRQDYLKSLPTFEQKMRRYAPRVVAFLGKPALAAMTGSTRLVWGPQTAMIGNSRIWLLPNPSGRNRAFTTAELVEHYRALRENVSEHVAQKLRAGVPSL